MDGYILNENKMLLNSLTQACRLVNDTVKTRLPIRVGLLEMILFEVEHIFTDQPYLEIMYKALFSLAYYGLFRVGELAAGDHSIKAKDVHVGQNKNKILAVLYSSKTHGSESRPQETKITSDCSRSKPKQLFFSPFEIVRTYMAMRGGFEDPTENFFVFRDKSVVQPNQVRTVLRTALNLLNLDDSLYDTHSFRIGRASDLFLKWNYSIEEIKIFWVTGRVI